MTIGVSDEAWAGVDPAEFRLTSRERLRVVAAAVLLVLVVAAMIVGRISGFTSLKLDIVPDTLSMQAASHVIVVRYDATNTGWVDDRIVSVTPTCRHSVSSRPSAYP